MPCFAGYFYFITNTCIDLAMHMVAENKLGIPHLAKKLKAMVGFRNIAVHDYQKLNLDIIQKIIKDHLVDFKKFATAMLRQV
ncbi:DUF86 domain-containing protein [Peptococcaceae bacterium 1198_IL3148]